MSLRPTELTEAAKAFNAAWDAWVAAENRQYPDATLFDAFDDLFAVLENGDIPAESRPLCDLLSKLRHEWEEYNNREDVGVFDFANSLKAARENIVEHLHVKALVKPPELESIAKLREQKCSDSQIAAAYNFYDRNGYALAALVEKEFADPGSVTRTPGAVDGKDWVHPFGLPFEPKEEKPKGKK